MALDIEGLTKVINAYLSSLSDVSQSAGEAAASAERKRIFTDTLGEAIKAETQKNLADFPDISSMIQKNIESHMRSDTSFTAVSDSAPAQSAQKISLEKSTDSDVGNADAYKGQLSTQALQELAKSGYFSGNLIQGNLFSESSDENTASTSTSAFDTASLSDLNSKYLLASYLNKNTDAVKSVFGDFLL